MSQNTELRFRVAPVWKGSYNPSTTYNISDEVSFTAENVPVGETTNVTYGHYRSLKDNNTDPLTNDQSWLLILDLSNIESVTKQGIEYNQQFNANETLRKENERQRVENEDIRVNNELTRVSNENERKSAETRRVDAENNRNSAENNRKSNELSRSTAELQRKSKEEQRILNENDRNTAESTRKANEATRQSNETNRRSSETTRQSNESTRKANETARQQQEGAATDNPNPTGSRWARYKQAENERTQLFNASQNNRTTLYNQAEGTPEDEASANGSRWARFKKAEEDRDTKVDEKVGDITRLQEEVEELNTKKANTDGSYNKMTVGSAENLVGKGDVEANYTLRTSGGTADIGTGTANMTKLKGNTLCWNQLLKSDKFVDLGLPSGTIWATCNIDVTQEDGFAASPFQYGCTMFSWGNIVGHNTPASGTTFDYNWGGVNAEEPFYEGQPYGETPGSTLSKDVPIGDIYDAARYNVGSIWKTPSKIQFKELIDNCIFIDADGNEVDTTKVDKRVNVNGVIGLYLQSKTNGNRLFFAASGYGAGSSWKGRGASGSYWSASFGSSRGSWRLYFVSAGVNPQNIDLRYNGFAVKPVFNPTNIITIGHNNDKYIVRDGKNIFNLTRMFGSGSEPTLTEFDNLYPYIYPYNAGELISNNAVGIETVGFNQYNPETGKLNVIKDNKYQITGTYTYIKYSDGTSITPDTDGYFTPTKNDELTITGGNATDTCIHLSWSGIRDGEYEPYKKETFYFNGESGSLATIKGKVNGAGESVVIFPEGMKSAGVVFDELTDIVDGYFTKAIKRIGSVDLGTLDWNCAMIEEIARFSIGVVNKAKGVSNIVCSKYEVNELAITRKKEDTISGYGSNSNIYVTDSSYTNAATFKAAMSGVILYYELATPIIYTLDIPVPVGYSVDDFGVEQRLPKGSSLLIQAPISYNVQYAMNATDTIRRLPINFTSKESLENLLITLGNALNGEFSMAYNSETNRYVFNFTPNN